MTGTPDVKRRLGWSQRRKRKAEQVVIARPIAAAIKRLIDVVAGAALAVLTLPVVLVLCVVGAVAFRAWPIFSQVRIGRRCKSFRFFKIRSLHRSVNPDATKYELDDEKISAFGRFIRSSHLDELPQLWLAMLGSMSLVGPRPEMPHLYAEFSEQQLNTRRPFRPGITGLWQISEHCGGLMVETPEYDAFYAQYHCTRLDLWILWKTAARYIGGRTITLDGVPGWVLPRTADLAAA